MGDEDERRRALAAAELLEKLQKMFARYGIEPGAWFVEDHQRRIRHQRPSNEHALALALRQDAPRSRSEMRALDALEDLRGALAVLRDGRAPVINHRVLAAHDRFQRRLIVRHHLPNRRTDQPNTLPQLAPIRLAIVLAQHFD